MNKPKTLSICLRSIRRVIALLAVLLVSPVLSAHPAHSGLSAAGAVLAGATGLIRPPKTLTNPNATDEAKSLMSFLVDMYGHKVISGQQAMEEIVYVHSVTGKQPAMGVFDLMNYSPSRIEHGANPTGLVESWIHWAQTGGGIVSLSWHWNAPTDLINVPDKEWWRGFYTYATTFDVEAALADPGGEKYQLLIRDLDAIADELVKFQTAGLPVLWRPLHEASGGWFWWGAKGPGPFIELWQLMYDRYVNVHGLDHLIWVYTVGDHNWYPGDAYVDIVGMDIYPSDPDSTLSGFWQDTYNVHGADKLVALTESGILPDPDKIRQHDVWWSWFSVWSGHFIRNIDPVFLNAVYHDADIITLDQLIDWKNYPHNSSPPTCSVLWPWNNVKIPVNADVTLRADADVIDSAIVKVEFFNGPDKLGQALSAPYTYTWNQIPPGVYTLRTKATDGRGLVTTASDAALVVGSGAPLVSTRYEAEDAVSDGPGISKLYFGYSGTGSRYFNKTAGTGVTFTVYADYAGNFPLTLRYQIPSSWGDKKNKLLVNGVLLWEPMFANTGGSWTSFEIGNVALNAGYNTIRVEHDWGYIYLDYIQLMLPGQSPYQQGDLNMSGDVDIGDLAVLSAGWGNPYTLDEVETLTDDWLQ